MNEPWPPPTIPIRSFLPKAPLVAISAIPFVFV
jgi:hypothetical protein